jgi:hypothetical protein
MFASPFAYCAVSRAHIFLFQSPKRCALEHSCAAAVNCPLQRFFTEMQSAPGASPTRRGPAHREGTGIVSDEAGTI